ncbi:hypothetical protein [Anthocerotibacter panamensis]|uniref:hypothetical protein n=1 Tax=Anthocerotibacter panamensis TaxID=2857077 RepID=UPI001C401FEE|nr:hypothetical protein [Anthocerotibacter panamensis]
MDYLLSVQRVHHVHEAQVRRELAGYGITLTDDLVTSLQTLEIPMEKLQQELISRLNQEWGGGVITSEVFFAETKRIEDVHYLKNCWTSKILAWERLLMATATSGSLGATAPEETTAVQQVLEDIQAILSQFNQKQRALRVKLTGLPKEPEGPGKQELVTGPSLIRPQELL